MVFDIYEMRFAFNMLVTNIVTSSFGIMYKLVLLIQDFIYLFMHILKIIWLHVLLYSHVSIYM